MVRQLLPVSAGHVGLAPVQFSARSHAEPDAGLHTPPRMLMLRHRPLKHWPMLQVDVWPLQSLGVPLHTPLPSQWSFNVHAELSEHTVLVFRFVMTQALSTQ